MFVGMYVCANNLQTGVEVCSIILNSAGRESRYIDSWDGVRYGVPESMLIFFDNIVAAFVFVFRNFVYYCYSTFYMFNVIKKLYEMINMVNMQFGEIQIYGRIKSRLINEISYCYYKLQT
jgi:hypothetical protein